jgi:pSer/pThr/pTyr-binding forkhead associated (FHA) protein
MPDLVFSAARIALALLLLLFVYRLGRLLVVETQELLESRQKPFDPAKAIGSPVGGTPGSLYVVTAPNQRPRTIPLKEEMTIGRSLQCDLSIPDDKFISQFHARVSLQNNSCVLEDLGSTNGTYLNGVRIIGPTKVQRGDRVALGNTIIEFRK